MNTQPSTDPILSQETPTTLFEPWASLQKSYPDSIISIETHLGETTLNAHPEKITLLMRVLRDQFHFETLIDLSAVDYAAFGKSEWKTSNATSTGFSRAAEPLDPAQLDLDNPQRFAVVYHLLSLQNNTRLRVKAYLSLEHPVIHSISDIWPVANWYEREAFDLMGIIFEDHPDLRRILTDYGFVGHPFRKDFPVSGTVEMRYDAEKARVIYGPVEIEPRVLVPKVIR